MFRVTQRTMYSNMTNQMNSNLSAYMDSQMQGSTMKKVNKPSDDPAGMARILKYRNTIDRAVQMEQNSDAALGWLQLADSTLSKTVSSTITEIKTLAEQAATGTYTAEQRNIIGDNIRQQLETLLNAANNRYEDKTIFGGQNYNDSAFEMGLGVTATSWGKDGVEATQPNPPFQVSGNLTKSIKIRFPSEDDKTANESADLKVGTIFEWYDFSSTAKEEKDRWMTGTVRSGENESLVLEVGNANTGKATLTLPAIVDRGTNSEPMVPGQFRHQQTLKIKEYAEDVTKKEDDATYLYVRPAVIYQGDDNNALTRVDQLGMQVNEYATVVDGNGTTKQVTAQIKTKSPSNIQIQVTGVDSTTNTMTFSYSVDNGKTWVQDNTAEITNTTAHLDLPNGGYVDIAGADQLAADDFISVRNVEAEVSGRFSDNIQIKFPKDADIVTNNLDFAYSVDNGKTWIEHNTAKIESNKNARLILPGGYVDITAADMIKAGNQMVLRPQRTDVSFTVLEGQTITVNNVGKDIFGGLYTDEYGTTLNAMYDQDDDQSKLNWEQRSPNTFEVIGRLIGYCETNNQNGIQRALEALDVSQKKVLSYATDIGGKENRLESTLTMLGDKKYNDEARVSSMEDIDVTELMINLIQRQTAYQTVLQSSSMIMQLNLAQYL